MGLPTIDQKIAWALHQIKSFEQTIAESEDKEFIRICKHQLTFFYAVLDDLYSIRLWNQVHQSEKFDINILPIMQN